VSGGAAQARWPNAMVPPAHMPTATTESATILRIAIPLYVTTIRGEIAPKQLLGLYRSACRWVNEGPGHFCAQAIVEKR
jgi:hypothetical protein